MTEAKYSLEPPLAFGEALAERIRRRPARRQNVEGKKLFGGVGFLLNGNMLVGVWKDSLIARLRPDQGNEAPLEPYVQELWTPRAGP